MTSSLPLLTAFPETSRAVTGRWLSVVSHTDPRYGGLSSAVPRGAQDVAVTGRFEVSLAAFCAPGEQFQPATLAKEQLSFWPVSRAAWLQSRALRRQFAERVRGADGVHIHGLWEVSTAAAGRTARGLGKPYIVSAHGMLEPWALANKRLKKAIYGRLMERSIVGRASCLHALTAAEAEQYRAFGAKCPIVVIPNAVEIPEYLSPDFFFETYPALRDKRMVLFLGRLHPKKGLTLLVDAWGRLFQANPEAHLVLAGPDSEETAAKLAAVIASRGMERSVTFTGMLDQPMKWSALAAAECFVLPSFSEGLSMGVLEALGAGVPAIITHHCNMPEVTAHGAGWEIGANVEELAETLRNLLDRSPEENRRMGTFGAEMITTLYNPRHVAEAMADLYEFAQTGIPPSTAKMLFL